jgi:predicted dithiol-disulfide oxidoreductase (DUF899 family)
MDNGPDDDCPGCTNFTNNVPQAAPAVLAERGVTWVTVSNMPLAQIEGYKARMGWTLPFVSSCRNTPPTGRRVARQDESWARRWDGRRSGAP